MTTTRKTIDDVLAMQQEAKQSGDPELAATCDRALMGDEDARQACKDTMEDARGQWTTDWAVEIDWSAGTSDDGR